MNKIKKMLRRCIWVLTTNSHLKPTKFGFFADELITKNIENFWEMFYVSVLRVWLNNWLKQLWCRKIYRESFLEIRLADHLRYNYVLDVMLVITIDKLYEEENLEVVLW